MSMRWPSLAAVLLSACGVPDCGIWDPPSAVDPPGTGACRHTAMPSDGALKACFAEKRADLERLTALIRTERVDAVATDRIGDCWFLSGGWSCGWLSPSGAKSDGDLAFILAHNGLGAARYDEYLRLLRAVGAYRVVREHDPRVWQVHDEVVISAETEPHLSALCALVVCEGSNPTDVGDARISDGGNVLDSDGFAMRTIGESTNENERTKRCQRRRK